MSTQTTGATTAPAAQNQPAANTSAAPTTGAAAPAAAAPPAEWTAGFSDEMKGFVQNKGWKNVQEVADSYRNLEKLHGVPQDRILKLPESMESPEARAIWERLGAPKTAAEYKIDLPADTKDPKTAEWLAATFHELGIPKNMGEAFAKKANERITAEMAQAVENQKAAIQTAETALRQEWGAAYDKNKNLMNAAAKVGGMSAEEVSGLAAAIGHKRAAEFLVKVGNSVGEAAFIAGRPAQDGTVTPDQARAQLKDLYQDKAWVQKYTSGDFDAKKRMEQLQQMANPGEHRLT